MNTIVYPKKAYICIAQILRYKKLIDTLPFDPIVYNLIEVRALLISLNRDLLSAYRMYGVEPSNIVRLIPIKLQTTIQSVSEDIGISTNESVNLEMRKNMFQNALNRYNFLNVIVFPYKDHNQRLRYIAAYPFSKTTNVKSHRKLLTFSTQRIIDGVKQLGVYNLDTPIRYDYITNTINPIESGPITNIN